VGSGQLSKTRLDILLAERGLAESRSLAQKLVMAGKVRVDGQVMLKPGSQVNLQADLQVESGPPFVSRGGEKLQAALKAFPVVVAGQVCADVGASTGGFTDCLLQDGASKVYSIDVGYGILHWKLRSDPRVVLMERTNARYVQSLPEPASLVTIDASFISLKVLLPVVRNWFVPLHGEVIALIKPQFEAGREEASRGEGVIRDPKVHKQVVEAILGFARTEGYHVQGVIQSPLRGPKGNIEFLVYLKIAGQPEQSR
jgi:23S rRNA (cytidine1920-2'-O)/16S rRNA (cytidine1409-2'-O)-methyltransferase